MDKRLLRLMCDMNEIAALDAPTAADERRFNQLNQEFTALCSADSAAQRRAQLAEYVRGGRYASEAGSVGGDYNTTRGDAHRTVDELSRSGFLADGPAETVTALLERGPVAARTAAARHVEVLGSPHYLRAFHKLFDGPRGDLLWTPEERDAFAAVESFHRDELRAMSVGTPSAGGYMVPLSLDPAIMLSNNGVASPLRQVARVVTTATNSWSGVTSAGATATFRAEAAEVTDASPTLAEVNIPVHRMDCWVPYSIEVGMDAVDFVGEMGRLMADAANVRETQAFVTGTGTGEPQGVITGLAGGASVVTGSGEAFTSAHVYNVQAALPPRFSANAVWMGNVSTLNAIAQFESAAGARIFPEVNASPSSLLRKPLFELSPMDGVINPAATETNHILIYGDFRAGYIIVDRLGAVLEQVPHVVGPNRRPTGERGLILWQRVGAEVAVSNALRVLNIPTTA